MDIKRAKIDDKILDVVSYETYAANPELYQNTNTAVEMEAYGQQYVLPCRGISDDRPGLYPIGNTMDIVRRPSDDMVEYQPQNVIDFSQVSNMADMISKQSQLRNLEEEILTNPDDIFVPLIREDDSPEMVGLKQAVISKNIDLNKYAQRLGSNYANDKRIFKDKKTTLFKMIRICDALDIEVSLTFKDKTSSVPNPMGKEVNVVLNGAGGTENE